MPQADHDELLQGSKASSSRPPDGAVTLSCSALGAHLNWDLKCDIFSVAYLWGGARFYYHQSFLLCFLFLSSVWNKGG
ncbi:hypothetical protein ES319_D09G195500v1 [Gossypium barbadense]|uniref:Uncharacterized protein n=1 Tax=Gossypium barbadense TaxID=3634 RepID=A0A5J5Q680_GOSBA|nr:hypothetical protein ES319_D09G195500v1 [Gossypium barbadense]